MARIEKTVFISYRRTDVYTALAVYENLKNQGYDVFFDYRSISSGDFEQIITANIRARAHFLIILTQTALDRCSEPGDWLRREIELAIDERRNIIPLFFKGFQFGTPAVSEKLTGKLKNISRYNGLNVHEDFFDEAMQRLRTQYLSIPLNTVLHPVSTEVLKAVKAEQVAADEALEQIQPKPAPTSTLNPKETELENLKSQVIRFELNGDLYNALQTYYQIKRLDPLFPSVDYKIKILERELQPKVLEREKVVKAESPMPIKKKTLPWRLIAGLVGGFALLSLSVWGGVRLWKSLPTSTPEPTHIQKPTAANTPSPTPFTSYRWEFSSATENWGDVSQRNDVTIPKAKNGNLTFSTMGNNPYILSPSPLNIDAAVTPIITVRIRIISPKFNYLGAYFIKNSDPYWTEGKYKEIMVFGDGEFHVYNFDMSKINTWKGVITQIRLNPAQYPLAQVEIDYIWVHAP